MDDKTRKLLKIAIDLYEKKYKDKEESQIESRWVMVDSNKIPKFVDNGFYYPKKGEVVFVLTRENNQTGCIEHHLPEE